MNKKTLIICFTIALMLLVSTFIFPQYKNILGIVGAVLTVGTVIVIMLKYFSIYNKGKAEYFNKIEEMKKAEELKKSSENE